MLNLMVAHRFNSIIFIHHKVKSNRAVFLAQPVYAVLNRWLTVLLCCYGVYSLQSLLYFLLHYAKSDKLITNTRVCKTSFGYELLYTELC